jgi:hypothetical protein
MLSACSSITSCKASPKNGKGTFSLGGVRLSLSPLRPPHCLQHIPSFRDSYGSRVKRPPDLGLLKEGHALSRYTLNARYCAKLDTLTTGQPKCRTTRSKNLCHLASSATGFSTPTALLTCQKETLSVYLS